MRWPTALLLLALAQGVIGAQSQRSPGGEEASSAGASDEVLATVPSEVGQVRIETATERRTVTVGDAIRVTIRLIHPKDVRVTVFDPERAITDLTVLARESSQTVLPDGRTQETRTLSLARYEIGEFKIPSFEATFVDPSGNEGKVATPPVSITVGSVLSEGDTRPADIKNPAVMPERPLWPWILGAGLLASCIAFWIWRRLNAQRAPVAVAAPSAPPRPAHEVAYAELERLLSSGLLEKGRVKEFYIELAEIVKRYFETLFGVDTFELTSTEILEALRLARVPAKGLALTAEFFGSCDLVKFAKYLPAPEETRAAVERAYRLVDELKPRESQVTELAAAAGASGGRG